ncbi:MAG: GNAT family N-acetyltransferase [Alphaproteobacteria bacterium]|nr:GNAT family N-acetyltransferase [Alphaproteobacteria bacterium]
MIHIINKHNRHLYLSVLADMFRVRHQIFVEDRGWIKLANDNGLERDQFDTDETIYFLKLDENQKILGGMRLVPTLCDTQLSTIFKGWCDFKPAPQAQDAYEWSRYFIADKKYRSPAGYPVHYELFFAILEFAVYRGIRSLSGFLEAITLPRLNALPWKVEYLGNMITYGGTHGEPKGRGAAVQVSVDKRMLRLTKRLKGIKKPYFAIPLGEAAPARPVAFGPELCFQYLDFMEEHPDHTDALIAASKLWVDANGEDRKTFSVFFDNMAAQEAMLGFGGANSAKLAGHNYSLTLQ